MYIFQYLRHVLKLLPFQGATVPTRDTQGAASLALGWVLHWAFIDIIGCGSAIQASLIAFALHDDSARTNWVLIYPLYKQLCEASAQQKLIRQCVSQ